MVVRIPGIRDAGVERQAEGTDGQSRLTRREAILGMSALAVSQVLQPIPAAAQGPAEAAEGLPALTDADIIAFLDTPEFSDAWDRAIEVALEKGTINDSVAQRFTGTFSQVVQSTMLGDRQFPGVLQPILDEMDARLLVSLGRSIETGGLNFFERVPEGKYITLGNITIRAFRRFQAENETRRERNAADRERNAADRERNAADRERNAADRELIDRFEEFLQRFGV